MRAPASPRAVVPAVLLAGALAMVSISPLSAQTSPDPAAGPDTEEAAGEGEASSRQVDESEENFRARMELREQRFREQPRSNTTFSYSTSREGKLANLPPESREHVREQLRDLVIESRLWEPGEDLTGYPYEPSPAAKHDGLLARQEREAFVEQLQKYQEREAAAHAAAQVADRAAEGAAKGASDRPAEQPAARGGAGGDGEAGAAQRSTERAGAAMEPGTAGAGPGGPSPNAVSTAGVSESALDFVRAQGLAGEKTGQGGGHGDREQPENGGAFASTDRVGASNDGRAGSQAPGQAAEETADGEAGEAGAMVSGAPPGTVDIAALQSLEDAVAKNGPSAQPGQQTAGAGGQLGETGQQAAETGQQATQAGQSSSPSGQRESDGASAEMAEQQTTGSSDEEPAIEITMRDVTRRTPEPGTLDIEALQRLDLEALRAGLAEQPDDVPDP